MGICRAEDSFKFPKKNPTIKDLLLCLSILINWDLEDCGFPRDHSENAHLFGMESS